MKAFETGVTGSRETRIDRFAQRRIDRIAGCIGETAVRDEVAEVETAIEHSMDAETWRVFRHGSKDEWDAFSLKVKV